MLDQTNLEALQKAKEAASAIVKERVQKVQMDEATSADTSTQVELEQKFAKNMLKPAIREEFIKAEFDKGLVENKIPVDFGLDLLVSMVLHKRADIVTLVGQLWHHFKGALDPFQECADHIYDAVEKGLVDWEPAHAEGIGRAIVAYDINESVRHRIDVLQHPLPMVEQPQEVHSNYETGYRTIRGSLILKDNHHDKDICLDHINRCNRVELSLDADVVAFVQNQWKNHDQQKPDEDWEKFDRRRRAFRKYDAVSRDVLTALMGYGNRFWLTHRYDKRGRTYARGYHVNYQGNDWNKACVVFADAEPLNAE